MNNVSKTIGWAEWTWNPVVGCKRGCSYCYAKKIYDRFNKTLIPFNEIQYHPFRLFEPCKIKKPSRIFVGSMTDICYWQSWEMVNVIEAIKRCPQHTFMFLTKDGTCYKNYVFPNNCWLGVTYTKTWDYSRINKNLRFMSMEPLMDDIGETPGCFDWFIVGGLSPKPIHEKQWIDTIVEECKKNNKPLFIKDNAKYPITIKQFPEAKQ